MSAADVTEVTMLHQLCFCDVLTEHVEAQVRFGAWLIVKLN